MQHVTVCQIDLHGLCPFFTGAYVAPADLVMPKRVEFTEKDWKQNNNKKKRNEKIWTSHPQIIPVWTEL